MYDRPHDQLNDDDPFSYRDGEEPPEPQHFAIGICAGCDGIAYTFGPDDTTPMCFCCAIAAASF